MQIEIDETIRLVSRFLSGKMDPSLLQSFLQKLYDILIVKYRSSWDVLNPYRGTGNRVIVGGFTPRDNVIVQACMEAHIPVDYLIQLLPHELYIFTNPGEVSYRIGDDGSIHDTYNAANPVDPLMDLEGIPKAETRPEDNLEGKPEAKPEGNPNPQTITIVKRMTPEDEHTMPPALYFQMMVQQLAND